MKILLFTALILLLVNLSKQADLSPITDVKEKNLKAFVEIKQNVCGCDTIPVQCLKSKNETDLNRPIRSIESPITTFWNKLKGIENQDIDTPQVPPQKHSDKQDQQASCQTKIIKCDDKTHTMKIIKADLSNTNKNTCPFINVNVDQKKNHCDSNRIQATELAQKLCDGKNECKMSLESDGFEKVCECATQKYLELIYMCIPKQTEKSSEKEETISVRSKRQSVNRRNRLDSRRGLGYGYGALGYGYDDYYYDDYYGEGYNGLGRRRNGGRLGQGRRGSRLGGYGGYGLGLGGLGGLGGLVGPADLYDYALMSGYGIGFPRVGINQGFKFEK